MSILEIPLFLYSVIIAGIVYVCSVVVLTHQTVLYSSHMFSMVKYMKGV